MITTIKELAERRETAMRALLDIKNEDPAGDGAFKHAVRLELAERACFAAEREFGAAIKKLSDDELRGLLS